MKLRTVPISKIQVPDVRVTAVYDDETRELLRGTVEKLGILSPVILVQAEEGYQLVDGLHRLQEAQRLGETTLQAVVYEGDQSEALMLNLLMNRVRGKTKASEELAVVRELADKYGKSLEDIEAQTGLPRRRLEDLLLVSQGAPDVLEALEAEVITLSAAVQVCRLPTHIQQSEIMAKWRVWRWTAADLKKQIDELLRVTDELRANPPKAVERKPSRYICKVCNREWPPEHLRIIQLCPECFTEAYRALQGAIAPQVLPQPDGSTPGGS